MVRLDRTFVCESLRIGKMWVMLRDVGLRTIDAQI